MRGGSFGRSQRANRKRAAQERATAELIARDKREREEAEKKKGPTREEKLQAELKKQSDAMFAAERANVIRMMDKKLGIQADAKMRMTEAQARDPNNPVAVAFRKFYEKQAGQEGKRGLADVGVLQALGAQAFGSQLGGGMPVSTGQMQALMAQSQNQAGQAFANTQKRMQALRDQGIQMGQLQTEAAYNRGLGALDRYGQLSQMRADLHTGRAQRESDIMLGGEERYMAMQTARMQAKAAADAARAQQQGSMASGLMGMAGTLGAAAITAGAA